MMRECLAYIVFNDGTGHISKMNLLHNAPFALKEMEQWIKEQMPNVKSVKCSKINKDINAALRQKE